jgi:glutamyl-tRNA synthetase
VARGRYAPSPTGAQHLGNARTALVAWVSAREAGLVLRVEDLDPQRTVPEALEGNLEELRWLGLDWLEGPDVGGPYGPYRQSERAERYRDALARLEAQGRLFACWLSRRELREIASAPHGRGPVYGPAERARNARVAADKRAAGRTPALRLRVPERVVTFEDRLAGPQAIDLAREVGDTVLRRADGLIAYHLAVVVDDAAMAIEEVVRGDDLLHATAVQDELHRALGSTPPRVAHVPLLLGPDGARLAKRRGGGTLAALRAAGVPPERVVGLLAWSLGQLARPRACSAAELAAAFDPTRIPRHPVRLDDAALAWLHGSGPAPHGPPPGPRADAGQDALDSPREGR